MLESYESNRYEIFTSFNIVVFSAFCEHLTIMLCSLTFELGLIILYRVLAFPLVFHNRPSRLTGSGVGGLATFTLDMAVFFPAMYLGDPYNAPSIRDALTETVSVTDLSMSAATNPARTPRTCAPSSRVRLRRTSHQRRTSGVG